MVFKVFNLRITSLISEILRRNFLNFQTFCFSLKFLCCFFNQMSSTLFHRVLHSRRPAGRVFVLNLQNSTGLSGFRDAERACASLGARLASSAELRHAVAECFFSPCTRGWLYGGTVG